MIAISSLVRPALSVQALKQKLAALEAAATAMAMATATATATAAAAATATATATAAAMADGDRPRPGDEREVTDKQQPLQEGAALAKAGSSDEREYVVVAQKAGAPDDEGVGWRPSSALEQSGTRVSELIAMVGHGQCDVHEDFVEIGSLVDLSCDHSYR